MTAVSPGLQGAAALQAKLEDPKTAALLGSILDRLDVLDLALESVDGVLRRGEVIADSVGETLRDAAGIGAAPKDGAEGERLDPMHALATIIQLAPKLLRTLESLEPALGSQALSHMAQPRVLDALAQLAESKVLEREVVDSVGTVGEALLATTERNRNQPRSIGLFGMLSVLGNPDVKRAMGFFATFMEEYGRRLR
jgi:uncharacterized protein YjgD (DUF1641 family)